MKLGTAVLVLLGAMVVASSESAPVSAQQPSPSAPPVSVIQIGLDLVRIDAAVVDHAGRPVTDLRPEDFTIEVDGRKQPVTNAALHRREAPSPQSMTKTPKSGWRPQGSPSRSNPRIPELWP